MKTKVRELRGLKVRTGKIGNAKSEKELAKIAEALWWKNKLDKAWALYKDLAEITGKKEYGEEAKSMWKAMTEPFV